MSARAFERAGDAAGGVLGATVEASFRAYFEECYASQFLPLKGYLVRYTRDPEEAADLAQETFVRLWVSRSTPRSAVAWLRRVGYRLFVDRCRRRGRAGEAVPLESLPARPDPLAATPEEAWLERESRGRYEQLLSGLGATERFIFQSIVHDQASYRQIGETLGCPENTVKSVVRRARLRLAKRM
jgi:RNA polymerase sigma-70 factor (ECF subfamily)